MMLHFCTRCQKPIEAPEDLNTIFVLCCPACGSISSRKHSSEQIIPVNQISPFPKREGDNRIQKIPGRRIKLPGGMASEDDQLGTLEEIHRTTVCAIVSPIIVGIGLFLFGIICLSTAYLFHDNRRRTQILAFAGLCMSLVTPVYIILAVVRLFSQQTLFLYSHGVVRRRWFRTTLFSWIQFEGFYRTKEPQIIGFGDAGKLNIHDLAERTQAQLYERASRELSDRVYPQMLEAYNNGQSVSFGNLSLSQSGLGWKNTKKLLWQDLDQITIDHQGILMVSKKGSLFNWISTSIERILNFALFEEFVQRHASINYVQKN